MHESVAPCYLCMKPAPRVCPVCKRPVCEDEKCLPDPTLDECEGCTRREMLATVASLRNAPENYASEAKIDVAKLRRFLSWETCEDLYVLVEGELDRLQLAAKKK